MCFGRSRVGAKIKKFRLTFVALIMLLLLVVTGCQKKVTVRYGYKLSCLNCQKIIKSKTDSKSVLVGDASRWKIEKINVPCSKDQAWNQKKKQYKSRPHHLRLRLPRLLLSRLARS